MTIERLSSLHRTASCSIVTGTRIRDLGARGDTALFGRTTARRCLLPEQSDSHDRPDLARRGHRSRHQGSGSKALRAARQPDRDRESRLGGRRHSRYGHGSPTTADSYTLLSVGASTVLNAELVNRPAYDQRKVFVPIAQMTAQPYLLAVNAAVPAQTVGELIVIARSSPGSLNAASPGMGSMGHLALELFKGKSQALSVRLILSSIYCETR